VLELPACQLLLAAVADAAILVAVLNGFITVSPLSAAMFNVSLVITLRRPKGEGLASELKALPALAAAGTIVVQVTGSRIRLFELLAASSVEKVRRSFGGALASCYRGEGVEEALEDAAGSLPYQGLRKGMGRLGGGQGVETVGSEAALSSLDLNSYYVKALETLETRASLLQALAFFSPMISLIAFPRFFGGAFDAAALLLFSLSALRFVSAELGA
jgi:hypothetical protein